MLPLSALVIKRLELLLINWLVIFLFSIICLSLSLRIKEERAKPLRIEIDLFLHECLCRSRKFIDVRLNIFNEFNCHFFLVGFR